MKKKTQKNMVRRKQKQAAKEAARKKLNRQAKEQVRIYMKQRRHMTKGPPEKEEKGEDHKEFGLDDEVALPKCSGAGVCCRNRSLLLEHADVFRIIHNERAREHFELVTTNDLYHGKKGGPPILYRSFDEDAGLPFCMAVWVADANGEKDGDNLCPFLIEGDVPECILGEDRPTQCKADPVIRLARISDKRLIEGWKYSVNDTPCIGCPSASMDGPYPFTVKTWLDSLSMTDRYEESDMFLQFCNWLRTSGAGIGTKRRATEMLFNWDWFSMEANGMTPEEAFREGPKDTKSILFTAKMATERWKELDVKGKKDGSGE